MNQLDTTYLCSQLGEGFFVRTFSEISSTNEALLQAAREGAPTNTLFVAARQSAGRGRLGKSFFSPADTGVYFSLLTEGGTPFDPARLTALMALCVCEAAESLGSDECRVKWVNDIYVNEKKCCGILAQGILEKDSARAVVGIGANLLAPLGGFPDNLEQRAGAFFTDGQAHLREDFVVSVCRRATAHKQTPSSRLLTEYRRRSNLLGRAVEVLQGDRRFFATVRDIDEDFRLVVEDRLGALHSLQSGEVSLSL